MYLEDSDATNSLHALPSMHEDGIKIKAHKLSILKALLNDRSQLSVSIQGIPSVFATIILAIDTKNEWLELDELVDNTAHAALLEKNSYRVSGRLKGINVDFSARITSHEKNGGLIRYRSTLPDIIYQTQRRASYRAAVGMMSSPEVHLILSDNQVIKGQLSDISSTGALISVPNDSPIGPGDRIEQCIFKTLDEAMTIVEAEVKRQIEADYGSRRKLGCRFLNLDLSTTQDIQRYSAAVERLNARRR
jgi:c-di-GMP-binding flagellar brake protein YcgR